MQRIDAILLDAVTDRNPHQTPRLRCGFYFACKKWQLLGLIRAYVLLPPAPRNRGERDTDRALTFDELPMGKKLMRASQTRGKVESARPRKK